MKALVAILGFTLGNFLYQTMTDMNWLTAIERSILQAVAILAFVVMP